MQLELHVSLVVFIMSPRDKKPSLRDKKPIEPKYFSNSSLQTNDAKLGYDMKLCDVVDHFSLPRLQFFAPTHDRLIIFLTFHGLALDQDWGTLDPGSSACDDQ